MATIRQQRLAIEIIGQATGQAPPKMARDMLVDAGYSYATAIGSTARTMGEQGVIEELAKNGFSENNAKRVVAEIMLDPDSDNNARLKAAEMAFKVAGSYAPEKRELSGQVNTGPSLSAELIAIAEEELKKRKLNADPEQAGDDDTV